MMLNLVSLYRTRLPVYNSQSFCQMKTLRWCCRRKSAAAQLKFSHPTQYYKLDWHRIPSRAFDFDPCTPSSQTTFPISTRTSIVEQQMMAPSTKRRQSKPDSEQEDSIQTKRAKTTKAQTPPVRPGPAGPSSPSRGRNSIAASTVAWIRSENTNLVPFNDMEWLDRNIYGIFSDVKVTPSTKPN